MPYKSKTQKMKLKYPHSAVPYPRPVRLPPALRNRYYVASDAALTNNWGHRTLAAAVAHATRLLGETDASSRHNHLDEKYVVQIIRVVKRQRAPIVVEVVK